MNLPFKEGIRRADRDNTIDVYISEDEHDDVLRDGAWQQFFTEQPEVLTLAEKKEWIAKNTNVALGSDAFFPFGDNIERAHKSGVQFIAQAGGSVRDDHCDAATAEEYMAGLNTHKALVYVKTGRPQEAETAYKRFLGTNYSKTSKGLIEHSEYLELAERWNDLANLSPKVDSVILSWGTPLSLYYLKSYLSPYLKAYLKSGRKEQALAIAERIAESTD